MAYIIERADSVASMLNKFTHSHAYQVAGQYANIEFWISETRQALASLSEYDNRFDRMVLAQREWIKSHDVVAGSYCLMCEGQCKFGSGPQPPGKPKQIPLRDRNEASQNLKDAFYFFIVRCFRMHLVDERSLRKMCCLVGTSIEPRDLIRK